jgi:hypothetical protein
MEVSVPIFMPVVCLSCKVMPVGCSCYTTPEAALPGWGFGHVNCFLVSY